MHGKFLIANPSAFFRCYRIIFLFSPPTAYPQTLEQLSGAIHFQKRGGRLGLIAASAIRDVCQSPFDRAVIDCGAIFLALFLVTSRFLFTEHLFIETLLLLRSTTQ